MVHLETLILSTVMISSVIFTGCSKSAPSCNELETKNMVSKIAKEEFIKILGSEISTEIQDKLDKSKFEVLNVRTNSFNKDIGRYECAADLKIISENEEGKPLPITYVSELVDDGSKFMVSVYGIN